MDRRAGLSARACSSESVPLASANELTLKRKTNALTSPMPAVASSSSDQRSSTWRPWTPSPLRSAVNTEGSLGEGPVL